MQMKFLKQLVAVMAMVVLALSVAWAETKYDTSTTGDDCSVNFSPKQAQQMVTAIETSCDYPLGLAKFYTRSGNRKTASPLAATTNIYCSAILPCTNGDTIAYVHVDGTVDIRTVGARATSTNCNVSVALSGTPSVNDVIYKLAQAGQIVVADNTANNGTNKLADITGRVFYVPFDSPLYVTLSSTTNTSLMVTVE
jgi:hypothetical protein